MCHMLADSEAELLAMADRIGVARRWYQRPGVHKTSTPHFDICLAMKAKAICFGAVELKRPDDSLRLLAVIKRSREWFLKSVLQPPPDAHVQAIEDWTRQGFGN